VLMLNKTLGVTPPTSRAHSGPCRTRFQDTSYAESPVLVSDAKSGSRLVEGTSRTASLEAAGSCRSGARDRRRREGGDPHFASDANDRNSIGGDSGVAKPTTCSP